MTSKKPGNRKESLSAAGLRMLRQRLDELVPKDLVPRPRRPLARGSKYSFDETGCIANPRQIFQAIIDGTLKNKELEMVLLHKLHCWKCNQTFAALRSEFEETLRKRFTESSREQLPGVETVIGDLGGTMQDGQTERPNKRRGTARGGR
ncbi:MAG: hypothetical protein IT432_12205 [Phycisphaerales bacterium]|nr:hypothetical protein [Phycisphaerales bacterium]